MSTYSKNILVITLASSSCHIVTYAFILTHVRDTYSTYTYSAHMHMQTRMHTDTDTHMHTHLSCLFTAWHRSHGLLKREGTAGNSKSRPPHHQGMPGSGYGTAALKLPSGHIHTLHTHEHAYIHTYMHIHTYIHINIHRYTCMHMHVYIHYNIHLNIHTYLHPTYLKL